MSKIQTPRVNELKRKIDPCEASVDFLADALNMAHELAENLEKELAVAKTGWEKAEADNLLLFADNARVRAVLTKTQKAADELKRALNSV